MENDILAALKLASDTKDIIIEDSALDEVVEVYGKHFGDAQALVVADQNTMAAAGRRVHERLLQSGCTRLDPFVFPGRPRLVADFRHVLEIEAALPDRKLVLVAVGAGTINDICKVVAYRASQPYMSVATAASMDGYASSGAPMVQNGFKHSLPCMAPLAVLADFAVLSKAPSFLAAAGYGDLLGKITAGADWIVADVLGIESIDTITWDMVQPHLTGWLSRPEAVAAGDGAVIAGLLEGLTMSGLAMQQAKSSRPASGSEHQLCHLWEMQDVRWEGEHVPHGFAVGVGTLAMAALYELLLDLDLSSMNIDERLSTWPDAAEVEAAVRRDIGAPEMAERAVEETLAKHLTKMELKTRLQLVQRAWPYMQSRLRGQLKPSGQIEAMLSAAGCPTQPQAFDVSLPALKKGYFLSRLIRRRYTVLDLAYEAGVLEPLVERLFAPGGFWVRQT